MKKAVFLQQATAFAHQVRSKNSLWPDIRIHYLAKELGMNHKKISRLLQRCKQLKIGRFAAILNLTSLGLTKILVKIVPASLYEINPIAETLHRFNQVNVISSIWANKPHFLIKATVIPNKINGFMSELSSILNKKVTSLELQMIANILIENNKPFLKRKTQRSLKVDERDIHLLRLLREDATLTLREMGQKMGLSAPAVHLRLRRFKNAGVILGYIFRLESVLEFYSGILTYCFLQIVKDDIPALVNTCSTFGETRIRYAYELYGEYNLLLEVASHKGSDLFEFYQKILKNYQITALKNDVVLNQRWRIFPYTTENFR